ncbi:hypothetical protein GCM10009681_52600 [Luedemannella helvata]|uniref:Uncharacterized protein n=1 Tax=Luedemannella helvata TaxID=349315 RepID=A0ABN2L6M0_9ACTN
MNRSGRITARWNRPNATRSRKSTRRVAIIAGMTRSRLMATTVRRKNSRYMRWMVAVAQKNHATVTASWNGSRTVSRQSMLSQGPCAGSARTVQMVSRQNDRFHRSCWRRYGRSRVGTSVHAWARQYATW